MPDPVEVELKLEYAPADRDRLLASTVLGSAGGRRRQLDATYFDTPDRRLAKAGYSLRIRRSDDENIQTIKAVDGAAAGLFVRGEWERVIDGIRPVLDDPAGPLRHLVDARDLKRVRPLFMAEIERLDGTIDSDGSRIEYAIDLGVVRAGNRAAELAEVELELKQGSPQALFDLARRLGDEVPLRLGVQTKSGRGYALVGERIGTAAKAEPVMLDAEGSAGTAIATIMGNCLHHYRLNESIILASGAIDAVHQARVALRRLRTALFLFKPLFDGDRHASLIDAECRWLAGELGAVRDIDVLMQSIGGAGRAALAAIRDSRMAHLRTLLESARVRMLPIDIAEWIAVGPWRSEDDDGHPRDRNVRAFAGERLNRLRRRIKRGAALTALDDEHLHKVRKDAKKLRYAAEFFVTLYPGRKRRRRLDRFLERLEALQDRLGELNDDATAPALLGGLGIDAGMPSLGRKERRRLIEDAEDCLDALVDSKRFWRG